MTCLRIIKQKLQQAAKPKDTCFYHQPSGKDQNLLPLTSFFTGGIFLGTCTQVFSAHVLSARNAPGFKGEGQLWDGTCSMWRGGTAWEMGSDADLDFRRPCKWFVRCGNNREHPGAVCWEAPKHPLNTHWASARCPQKPWEHFSTSRMLKSSEHCPKRGGKKPKLGEVSTKLSSFCDLTSQRETDFFFFFK